MMKRLLKQLVLLVALVLFPVILIDAARPANSAVSSLSPAGADKSAAALYKSYCATCHGNDGRAKTIKGRLKHTRDLTESQWQDNVSDERLFNSISNGRGKMPSFSKKLSDSEIDSLVNYVRRLRK